MTIFAFPPAPAAFMRLHEIMQQDNPGIDQVSDAISKDPGLSSLVLKTVNSSYFGLRNKVETLRQATALLGLLNIRNIVAGLALRRAMEDSDGPSLEGFWDSPADVAMVSAKLAKQFAGDAFFSCNRASIIECRKPGSMTCSQAPLFLEDTASSQVRHTQTFL